MIGQRVREMRMERKLSLSELSKLTKITKSYLSNIERNICTNPTIDVIQKLASGFKVHPSVFLNGGENKKELQSNVNSIINIMDSINSMSNEQLKELKAYVEIIEFKRKKLPITDLINFI